MGTPKELNSTTISNSSGQESPSKTAFDYIQMTFRYIMSGFVCFLITIYIYTGKTICYINVDKIQDSDLWLILFLSGLSGIIIYAMHHAFFDNLFYWIIVKIYSRSKNFELTNELKEEINIFCNTRLFAFSFIETTNKKIFFLRSQNYLRKMCGDYSTKTLQSEFDNKMAILIFLYGCCYTMLLYPFLLCYLFEGLVDIERVYKLVKIGIFLFIITLLFDWRVTRREIWMSIIFYKKIDANQTIIPSKYEKN